MLDHVHRQRNDRNLPVGVGQQRQERQHAVVQRHLLADRRIELVVHQRAREVPGEIRIARQIRQRPLPPALIRLGVRRADAEGEGRVGVEEELVHVVVVNDQEQIRPDLVQPLPCRHITVEQRRPESAPFAGRDPTPRRSWARAMCRCRQSLSPWSVSLSRVVFGQCHARRSGRRSRAAAHRRRRRFSAAGRCSRRCSIMPFQSRRATRSICSAEQPRSRM